MATVKHALQRLLDGLRSLPPRRRCRAGAASSKAPRVVIRRSGSAARTATPPATPPRPAPVTIRVATFNAAMFSMAPAVPTVACDDDSPRSPAAGALAGLGRRPKKGILKVQCPPSPGKKLRVSINLQDDEITAERSRLLTSNVVNGGGWKGKAVAGANQEQAARSAS